MRPILPTLYDHKEINGVLVHLEVVKVLYLFTDLMYRDLKEVFQGVSKSTGTEYTSQYVLLFTSRYTCGYAWSSFRGIGFVIWERNVTF